MAQNWWEQDAVVGAQSAPAQAPMPSALPSFKDPAQIAKDAEEDARKRSAESRAREAASRSEREWNATHNPDGSPKQDAGKATEAQAKAATLLTRIQGGFADIAGIAARNPSAQEPGYIESVRGGLDPSGIMAAPVRAIAGQDRRIVADAQRDVLDALLTLGTGAAYNKEQLEGQMASYFPSYGDSQEEIKVKNNRLQRLIASAREQVGPLADKLDAAVAPYMKATAVTPEESNAHVAQMLREGRRADEIAAYIKQTSGRDPTPDEMERIKANIGNQNPDVRSSPDGPDLGRAFHMGVGDVAEAVGDTLGIITNPVNTGINALFGTDIGTDLGQSFRDLTGAPEARTDSEKLISAINKGGTSALTFGGLARGAAPVLEGGARSVANVLGGNLATDTVTGATSALGGEYVRQKGGGPGAQMAASVLGGGAGLTAAGTVNALTNRLARTPSLPPLARIGREEGVDVSRAMAEPALQNRVVGTEATIAGGPIIQAALGRTAGQIERGVSRLGADGESMTPNVAGDAVKGAAERYIKTSGSSARKAYDKAEKLAGDIKLDAPTARQQADDMIARLSETQNTNSKEIAYLNGLREDLSKPISVGALRDLRTTLRKQISKGELTFGQNEARALGIMDALSEDIGSGLVANGRADAARQFSRADAAYRDRMDLIGGTIQKLIGKRDANRTPETIFNNFRNMASPKGDAKGLADMLDIMKPDERADIAATFADELGKNRDGNFSTAYLVSQAQKLPYAARRNVFGEDGAQSLSNLIELAKAHKRVTGGLNNSRTGVANDWKSLLANIVFGGGAGLFTGSPLTGIATTAAAVGTKAARDVLSARSLMSTDFTRWLAKAPATRDPAAINQHMAQLANIAAKNPAISGDIQALQQAIGKAANDNVGRAAIASDDEKE